MGKFLNTFFYGYMPRKWIRLVRFVSVLLPFLFLDFASDGELPDLIYAAISFRETGASIMIFFIIILPNLVLSWLLQPFFTSPKDNSLDK